MNKTLSLSIQSLFVLLLITSTVRAFSPGDFNGDGKEDFIAAFGTWSDPQSMFLSEEEEFPNEEFHFDILPTDPEFDLFKGSTWLTVGDFDGDGLSDIIVQPVVYDQPRGRNSSPGYVLLSNGNGAFTQHFLPDDLNLNFDFRDVVLYVGDFNGDGRDDLIRQTYESKTLDILLAVDDESRFFEAVEFRSYENDFITLFPADFNGDGMDDILMGDGTGTDFYLHLSNGDGSFEEIKLSDYNLSLPLQVGDFNGDGKADIFGAEPSSQYFFLFLSNGDGTFEVIEDLNIENSDIVGTWESSSGQWGGVGDFNGDGKDDIYIRTHDNEYRNVKQTLYFSNEKSFDQVGSLETSVFYNIYVGDFDGDGLADVLEYSSSSESDISIHFSNGDGTWRKQAIDKNFM